MVSKCAKCAKEGKAVKHGRLVQKRERDHHLMLHFMNAYVGIDGVHI